MFKKKMFSMYVFFLLYAMASSSYISFINLYLYENKISKSKVGLLAAIASFCAIIIQSLLGKAGDKIKIKNTLAIVLLLFLSISAILFLVFKNIIIITILMSSFAAIHASLLALVTAISLEYLHCVGASNKYGKVRLFYSIGFGLAGGILSFIINKNISYAFIFSCVFAMLAMIPLCYIPKIEGKAHGEKKLEFKALLKYKDLIILLIFGFLLCSANNLYQAYIPIYFIELGGSASLYSYAVFILAFSEIPFLLLSPTLIKKYGINKLYFLPIFFIAARTIIIALTNSPFVALFSNVLHGGGFIVIHLTLTEYASKTVEKKLLSSVQGIILIFIYSLSRIVGSLSGALLTNYMSLRNVFIINFVFLLFIGIFYIIYMISRKKNRLVNFN